jgi:hypothetical protein
VENDGDFRSLGGGVEAALGSSVTIRFVIGPFSGRLTRDGFWDDPSPFGRRRVLQTASGVVKLTRNLAQSVTSEVCRTDARKELFRSGDRTPFRWVARLASDCVAFTSPFSVATSSWGSDLETAR